MSFQVRFGEKFKLNTIMTSRVNFKLTFVHLLIRHCAVPWFGGRSPARYIGDGDIFQELQRQLKSSRAASLEQQLHCHQAKTSGEKTTETRWKLLVERSKFYLCFTKFILTKVDVLSLTSTLSSSIQQSCLKKNVLQYWPFH